LVCALLRVATVVVSLAHADIRLGTLGTLGRAVRGVNGRFFGFDSFTETFTHVPDSSADEQREALIRERECTADKANDDTLRISK